jgi:hypothetical protein
MGRTLPRTGELFSGVESGFLVSTRKHKGLFIFLFSPSQLQIKEPGAAWISAITGPYGTYSAVRGTARVSDIGDNRPLGLYYAARVRCGRRTSLREEMLRYCTECGTVLITR